MRLGGEGEGLELCQTSLRQCQLKQRNEMNIRICTQLSQTRLRSYKIFIPPLLHPVNSAKRSTKQDPLHSRKRNESLGEAKIIIHPRRGPESLALDDGDRLDRVEQLHLFFFIVAEVLVDEEGWGERLS